MHETYHHQSLLMDHIPRPIFGLSGPSFKIPYLCGTRYTYDGFGFASYPARAGKSLQTLFQDDGTKISIADLEFLQAWLFFGVLDECLDEQDWMIPFENQTTTLPFHSRLSTAQWIPALRKRRSQVRDNVDYALEKFDKCLQESVSVLNRIIDTRILPTATASTCEEDDYHYQFDRQDSPILILFSIQILLSSLFASRTYLFSVSSSEKVEQQKEFRIQWHSGIVDLLLQRAGWSHARISSLETNIPLKYFLSCIRGNDRLLSWTAPMNGYRGHMAQREILSPKHTLSTCACEHAGVEEQTILARKVLNPDQVNLVRQNNGLNSTTSEQHIQLVDWQEDSNKQQPYIAFSHVRAQNLGNSTAHSLPYCQLCLLQLLANSAHSTIGQPTAMYIDTLSLPFTIPFRLKELQNIYTIFRNATAVIVLDHSLTTTYTNTPIDRLIRIRASEWKSRLWTLREGLSARVLLFKFADGLHNLDEMLTQVPAEDLFLLFSSQTPSNTHKNDTSPKNLEYLEAFVLDLKSPPPPAITLDPKIKFRLYTTLRLAYLSQPRYRYFCEAEELRFSTRAVRLIERVYSSSSDNRQQQNDHHAIVARLSRVYASALQEGIVTDGL